MEKMSSKRNRFGDAVLVTNASMQNLPKTPLRQSACMVTADDKNVYCLSIY